MSSLAIALIVLVCVFGGALVGTYLRAVLPEHHLTAESLDTIKLSVGLIGTIAALVLGLLISSAKASFDRVNNGLVENAARVVMIDHILAEYGPEAATLRSAIKREFSMRMALVTSGDRTDVLKLDTPQATAESDSVLAGLRRLVPHTDAQREFKARALQIEGDLASTRTLLILHKNGSLPLTLMAVLVLWLVLIFTGFGLLGPRNGTAMTALFVGALAVSGAVLLMLELDQPFTGLIRINSAPLVDAVEHLGQ